MNNNKPSNNKSRDIYISSEYIKDEILQNDEDANFYFLEKDDSIWNSLGVLSDEAVVDLANKGDDYAFEHMIERYKPLIKNKARSYFLIGADQEDLIQEGTIGLFKAIRDFNIDRQTSFKSFADLCIGRQLITAIKTATRQKHGPLNSYISLNRPVFNDDSDRSLMEVMEASNTLNPEDLMISHENIRNVRKQVEKLLSPLEQKVLFYYLEGKSYIEIAQTLSRHSKSIDNALQRVKKKLESTIKEMKN